LECKIFSKAWIKSNNRILQKIQKMKRVMEKKEKIQKQTKSPEKFMKIQILKNYF